MVAAFAVLPASSQYCLVFKAKQAECFEQYYLCSSWSIACMPNAYSLTFSYPSPHAEAMKSETILPGSLSGTWSSMFGEHPLPAKSLCHKLLLRLPDFLVGFPERVSAVSTASRPWLWAEDGEFEAWTFRLRPAHCNHRLRLSFLHVGLETRTAMMVILHAIVATYL